MARPPMATTWCSRRARARRAACAWRCDGIAEKVDYINPHATSTPIGDKKEIEAIREVFGKDIPPISGTKSLTGHSLGATGAQEAIYCILMMKNGFICRERQYRRARSGIRRYSDRPSTPGQCRSQSGDLQQLRFWWDQCDTCSSGAITADLKSSGLMQGRRGLIMGVANDHSIAWGIAERLHAHGAELAFTYQGEAFGKRVKPLAERGRFENPHALRCRGCLDRRRGVRRAQIGMGHGRFRRACARLFRQERAQGPLCRYDAREFRAHHGDLLLLLYRDRARAPPS